ncbi:MAG: hypothetical protein M3329_04770, partial [Pseudomonadota bacterium]|nr:hypothetical protein [Pseudomonadota bacterium]
AAKSVQPVYDSQSLFALAPLRPPDGIADCPALNVIRLFLSCSLQLQWCDTRLRLLPIIAEVLVADERLLIAYLSSP